MVPLIELIKQLNSFLRFAKEKFNIKKKKRRKEKKRKERRK
jgi:hypothetical protein